MMKIQVKQVGRVWKAAFSDASSAVVCVTRKSSGNFRVYLSPTQGVKGPQVYATQSCDVVFDCGTLPSDMIVVVESDTEIKELYATTYEYDVTDRTSQFWSDDNKNGEEVGGGDIE